ncbi:homeobox KN domain-containing protein [Dipodascopsis tothii]|uniref:homeobox KN domain-containing protein n=1 Tax=Dipodascopsis tothii TaxID=44089 RepID=UPI0034CE7650
MSELDNIMERKVRIESMLSALIKSIEKKGVLSAGHILGQLGMETKSFRKDVSSLRLDLEKDIFKDLWMEIYVLIYTASLYEEHYDFINSYITIKRRKRSHNLRTEAPQRNRRLAPKDARVLVDWLKCNVEDPYPSAEEKLSMAEKTGLRKSQIENWFINARRRGLCRDGKFFPMVDVKSES